MIRKHAIQIVNDSIQESILGSSIVTLEFQNAKKHLLIQETLLEFCDKSSENPDALLFSGKTPEGSLWRILLKKAKDETPQDLQR